MEGISHPGQIPELADIMAEYLGFHKCALGLRALEQWFHFSAKTKLLFKPLHRHWGVETQREVLDFVYSKTTSHRYPDEFDAYDSDYNSGSDSAGSESESNLDSDDEDHADHCPASSHSSLSKRRTRARARALSRKKAIKNQSAFAPLRLHIDANKFLCRVLAAAWFYENNRLVDFLTKYMQSGVIKELGSQFIAKARVQYSVWDHSPVKFNNALMLYQKTVKQRRHEGEMFYSLFKSKSLSKDDQKFFLEMRKTNVLFEKLWPFSYEQLRSMWEHAMRDPQSTHAELLQLALKTKIKTKPRAKKRVELWQWLLAHRSSENSDSGEFVEKKEYQGDFDSALKEDGQHPSNAEEDSPKSGHSSRVHMKRNNSFGDSSDSSSCSSGDSDSSSDSSCEDSNCSNDSEDGNNSDVLLKYVYKRNTVKKIRKKETQKLLTPILAQEFGENFLYLVQITLSFLF